jgi:putative membrane protein
MIKKQFKGFLLRWVVASIAMLVCLNVFGHFDDSAWLLEHTWWYYVLAGLVFSLVNTLIKPLATILALPMMVVTFGAFTLVINALMMALTIKILPGVNMNVWGIVGSCVTVSVINWLANLATSSVK